MRIVRRVDHPASAIKVRELMAKSTVCGDPRQSLVEAASTMRSYRISALAVLDDGVIVGIVTERDLMRAIADGRDPAATHVSQYMTQSPRTIDANKLAVEAAAVMVKHRVRHLPVTDRGRLIGFLSVRNLLALAPWPPNLPVGEKW